MQLRSTILDYVFIDTNLPSADAKAGLEIATDTGAFATKLFTFATKISRSVAN